MQLNCVGSQIESGDRPKRADTRDEVGGSVRRRFVRRPLRHVQVVLDDAAVAATPFCSVDHHAELVAGW